MAEDIKKRHSEAIKRAKEAGKPVALILHTEEAEEHVIKYRLLIRPSGDRIFYNFEIAIDDKTTTVQIPLIGRDWSEALNTAEAILNTMSMDGFKKAKELVLKLQQRGRGKGEIEEL